MQDYFEDRLTEHEHQQFTKALASFDAGEINQDDLYDWMTTLGASDEEADEWIKSYVAEKSSS